MQHHYKFIDSLRGLAAMSVVLFHLNETLEWPPSLYQTIVGYGWLGVPIFFVISGFVVEVSARRSKSASGFLSRRFWRIYPPYLASIGVVLAVVLATKLLTGVNDAAKLPDSALAWGEQLLMLTSPVTGRPDLNWVYWSLTYEVAFYFLLAVTVAIPRLRWVIIGLITVAAVSNVSIPIFFLDHWTQFALGIAIAGWIRKPSYAPAILAAACTADLFLNRDLAEGIAAQATGILIVAAVWHRTSWLNNERLISPVGTISYSLYLIHVPLGVYVFAKFNPWPPGHAPSDLPFHILHDAVVLALCIACAWVFWRFVEEPAARRFGVESRAALAKP